MSNSSENFNAFQKSSKRSQLKTTSNPRDFKNSTLEALPAEAMTFSPSRLASCPTICPTAPEAADTDRD